MSDDVDAALESPGDWILPPKLETLLLDLKRDIFANLNCIQVGQISLVTKGAQTVQVQLQIMRLAIDGSSTSYPVLVDCPYFVLGGGGAYLDMPIAMGDYCIVLFNDRDIDNWWTSGQQSAPNSPRKHSLSDGFALVGVNPSSQVRAADGTLARLINPNGVKLQGGSAAQMLLGMNGQIAIGKSGLASAARKGDGTIANATTDPTNFQILVTLAAIFGMTLPSVAGQISSGSAQVQIAEST